MRMGLKEAKEHMLRMRRKAANTTGVMISHNFCTADGMRVRVDATANRIGFVYWWYDGSPTPRKAVESLLANLESQP